MTKTSVVTGAGSGVGQATALALVQQGWNVAIVGRRLEALQETVKLAGPRGAQLRVCTCDIGDANAVAQMAARVLGEFKEVDLVVNAAGTNTPQRSLEVLSHANYHEIVNANLHGSYYCVQAFLPGMRTRKSGTIINIVSVAGKQASAKSGPAYVVSKFAQAGLTQSINAEERGNGIRACSIFPGDIATPLLEKRPEPPPAAAREKMLTAADVAACVLFVANLPDRAVVEELVIQPK